VPDFEELIMNTGSEIVLNKEPGSWKVRQH
jgi:hypothetical protein